MRKPHWQDWVTYFLGLWVFRIALVFEAHDADRNTGRRNPCHVGYVDCRACRGLARHRRVEAFKAWEDWANVILGGWLLISPWVLGFSASKALMWNAVIFGAAVVGFAGWAIADNRKSTMGAS